jgi:anaerobic selenocysteine-containing dehydrogenase
MVAQYPLKKVSEITDVPVESIVHLAEDIGTIFPVTITCGYGMQRFTNGGQSVRGILSLLALTGNFGKAGAGWVYANLLSHIFQQTKDPLAFFPDENPDKKVRMGASIARLGHDILALKDPPVKIIWVERGNPVAQVPETPSVLQAFRKMDFCVVVDQFMTDTAREADVVLPAKSMFEQTDLINAYWHDYIQLLQKIIDPPGEVLPETEIYRRLAVQLGFREDDIRIRIPGPGEAEIIDYLKKKLEPFPELTIDKLMEGPLLSPFSEEIAWEDLRFPTPSGKIELFSAEASERWGVDSLPAYSEPVESPRLEGRKKFPLCLLTPNTKNTIHSQFGNLEVIRDIAPDPEVMVNPKDAVDRGIAQGDLVRVFNERGELFLKAAFDFGIKPGCVVIYNGWWRESGAGVNMLSLGRETDMAHGAAFHDTTVEILKVK